MTVPTSPDVVVSVGATAAAVAPVAVVKSLSKTDSRTVTTSQYLGSDVDVNHVGPRAISFDMTVDFDPEDTQLGVIRDAYTAKTKLYLVVSTEDDMAYPVKVANFNESSAGGAVVEASIQLVAAGVPESV